MQKHEGLRIKNVEERINKCEVKFMKGHDYNNMPVNEIEELCKVYSSSLD